MASLTSSQRNSLPKTSFALPGRRYPIDTENRARNALARVAQHGSPSEKARVRAAVHRKFPSIGKAEGGDVEEPMDGLRMKARAAALKDLMDWTDEEENERLRVTIDIEPNSGAAEEGEESPDMEAEEEKESAEHPEFDKDTIEQIVEDHAAKKEEEPIPILRPETEDAKKRREASLFRHFGTFSKKKAIE